MKIEPVYLVAPKPKPPSMTTRRAFVGMGLSFVVGGAIGSACGYSVGSAKNGAEPAETSATEDYPRSGNPELDELRRLAVKAPIEELMGVAHRFTGAASLDFPLDPTLWRGLRRISERLADWQLTDKRKLAVGIVQMIKRAPEELRTQYEDLLPTLQAVK